MKKSFLWMSAAILTCGLTIASCAKMDYPTGPEIEPVNPDEWELNFSALGEKYADKTGVTISEAVSANVGICSIVNGTLLEALEDGSTTNSEELDARFALQTGTSWLIRPAGLYQANGGDRAFGVLNCKRDQSISITTTAQPSITSGSVLLANKVDGAYVYHVTEDCDVIFKLARYNNISRISVKFIVGAEYTVRFVNDAGEKIKEDVVHKGEVGMAVALLESDKESIYDTEKGIKWTYDSDNAAESIVKENGSTVVTVKFKESAKYNARLVLKYSDGTRIKYISENPYVGDGVRLFYPFAFKNENDGKWYKTNSVNWIEKDKWQGRYKDFTGLAAVELPNGTLREDQDVEYILAEDIAFAAEFEDKSALTLVGECSTWIGWTDPQFWPAGQEGDYNANDHFDRYSNGQAARLTEGSYFATPALAAGTYKMFIHGRNGKKGEAQTVALYVMDAEGNMTPVDLTKTTIEADAEGKYNMPTISGGVMGTFQIGGIVIPEGGKLVIKNDGQASDLDLDFIFLTLNADADLVELAK
ncbi:MAG: hypothetical protein K2J00_06120 [Bacteroidaceae bacterium]|nr:hypothetical protein [Bacteroidaceae bacterium]